MRASDATPLAPIGERIWLLHTAGHLPGSEAVRKYTALTTPGAELLPPVRAFPL